MPPPSEIRPLATANNAFALDLWPRAAAGRANMALSPASLSIALAMTWLGAKGDTASQIAKTMHFEGSSEAVGGRWGKLAKALTTPPRSLELRIANRLYGERTYTFEPGYLERTRTLFGAPLETVDFMRAFEPARLSINGWVEEQTAKRITNLLPAGALDGFTRLVLVSAIYFLSDWAEPFTPAATREEPFDVAGGTKKNVPTMHRSGSHRLAQLGDATVLELPYRGDAAMLIALPKDRDGLSALEKSLRATTLDAWQQALAPEQVDVALPRFEVAPPSIDLAKELGALGMPLAFDRERADFRGIADPPDARERLHISKVFHKAFVKVDEKGTEAAAASAVVMAKGGGMPPKAIPFIADHPFLFFIVEKTSGIVLFMGRVTDPSVK